MEQALKEKNLKIAKESILAGFLASDSTIASSALSQSSLVLPGFTDVVKTIDYVEVRGANVTVRTKEQGPQTLEVVGKDKTKETIVLADVGEYSYTPSIVFEGGKTVSLSLLQLSPNTEIGGNIAQKMTGKQFADLVGKKLTCTHFGNDDSQSAIARIRGGQTENRVPKMYKFDVATV